MGRSLQLPTAWCVGPMAGDPSQGALRWGAVHGKRFDALRAGAAPGGAGLLPGGELLLPWAPAAWRAGPRVGGPRWSAPARGAVCAQWSNVLAAKA
eukprot:1317384-Alexandrium_andersonii.AAC.1